jgi:N-carbamoylputrescine amidase
MSEITVAALQLAFTDDVADNIVAVTELVREAAGKGARLILPPELFEGHYFCRTQDEGHFTRALPVDEHPAVRAMQALAPSSRSISRRASSKRRGITITTAWR